MLNRIVASVAGRVSPNSKFKRDLVRTALWHLEDVSYDRLKEHGFSPGGIIDIGAHAGGWGRSIRAIFSAPILMIDARESQTTLLQKVCDEQSDTHFHIGLLGSKPATGVTFHNMGSASSIFAECSDTLRDVLTLNMTTLDEVVSGFNLPSPLFLKLDVQGAELEVMNGGVKTLERAEIVQLEVPFLDFNEGAPTGRQVIDFMDDHGFSPFEIASFIRPFDKPLVQIDVLFARKDSPLRPKFFEFRELTALKHKTQAKKRRFFR